MTVTIQREPYSDALGHELLPLAQKCWDEGTVLKGENCAYHAFRNVSIEPDFTMYMELAQKNALIIFTVRDDALLVGYVVAMVYYSPHHCKILTANGDSIYVQPEYRTHSVSLVEKVINEVKLTGAKTMNWAVSPNSPMYDLLGSFGFVGDEVVMEKLLCA